MAAKNSSRTSHSPELGTPFDRCNLHELPLQRVKAHGGVGRILFHRIAGRNELAGPCNFIDLAEIPPGASIGRHTHEKEEEEFYLVLQGQGRMWQDGEEFAVREGDLVRNPPAGEHGLANSGEGPLRIFVWELEAT